MTNMPKEALKLIEAYLEKRAAEDPLFAAAYAKENKNLEECGLYIMGEARKQGNAVCMTDEQVFGLAVHYYDEDDIKINITERAQVTTTRRAPVAELTEEEKAAAKEAAKKRYEEECYIQEEAKARERKKAAAEIKKQKAEEARHREANAPSLFNFDDFGA